MPREPGHCCAHANETKPRCAAAIRRNQAHVHEMCCNQARVHEMCGCCGGCTMYSSSRR